MTQKEARQILEDYVKACREDDFFKIETGFTYEEVIEAMDMGAKSLLSHSLPSDLDDTAWAYVKKKYGIVEPEKVFENEEIAEDFKAGAQYAASRWISVDERLPEMDEEVIVLTDELGTAPIYKIAFGHIVDVERCIDYNGWNCPGVKYWMPCPKIPNND